MQEGLVPQIKKRHPQAALMMSSRTYFVVGALINDHCERAGASALFCHQESPNLFS